MTGKRERQNGKNTEFREVARVGRAFRGVMLPSGPAAKWKTVIMYVAVAKKVGKPGGGIRITPDCVTLGELREAIDNLKDDLDWVYRGLARIREGQQGESAK